ncbi:hypothetical protein [Desertivirga arenae]|uniref:hypothetical protein n=1 Tax=Desertivirga arenae TaxID=2810309 RepID=UPI001A97961F|nr:hypothetical protein [Pedobacter sp. SYSU D00823]
MKSYTNKQGTSLSVFWYPKENGGIAKAEITGYFLVSISNTTNFIMSDWQG